MAKRANDPRRDVVLFVHGFGSSAACWSRLLELTGEDPLIASRFECVTWEYPTKWVDLNLLGRIPSLKEVGRALGDEIDSPRYRGRRLTLVGHSQGGLVILTYLADMLTRGEAWQLKRIRQAILMATPCEGSNTGFNLRRLAAAIFTNPQEITLRTLDPDIAELTSIVRERIVGATRDTDTTWRLPIHSFCGLQDAVVPEASARGPFESVRRVPGTHFSILTPKTREDRRYSEFAEVFLDPGGHSHRYDVESYEQVVRVEPRPPGTMRGDRQPGAQAFEDYATVRRTVRFARANRCRAPFTLRYRTRSGVSLLGQTSHQNEAPPAERGAGKDTGKYFQFDFSPKADESYWLNVEVFGGFGPGQRDVHFHIDRRMHARTMSFTVDISAYVSAGWHISRPPQLCYQTDDVDCTELCRGRTARTPEPCTVVRDGVFSWRLEDLCTGVVDIAWDVAPADVVSGTIVEGAAGA